MSLAKFRKVHSKTGAGRFVVSEGIAPAAYLLPIPVFRHGTMIVKMIVLRSLSPRVPFFQ